jgi:cobalamin biosynthesis protein CobT
MSGERLQIARDCSIAIAEALENTKVKLEIVGHSTTHRRGSNYTDGSEEHETSVGGDKYNRLDAIRMTMFKGFNERLTHCHTAIGNMVHCSHCANADGDAWLYAYERLMQQPEKRKVMLCLADGYPAYRSHFGDEYQRTADVVAHMEKNGVDVIGIGIQSDCVKNYFRKYVVINEMSQLSKEVMDSLGKALLGNNFRVDNADLIKANRI